MAKTKFRKTILALGLLMCIVLIWTIACGRSKKDKYFFNPANSNKTNIDMNSGSVEVISTNFKSTLSVGKWAKGEAVSSNFKTEVQKITASN